jgi:hypothetical protein
MGTRQNDFLERELFTLVHFRALRSVANYFPSCLFPSIVNDIHIIGPFQLYYLHMNISKPNFMQWVFLSDLKNVWHGPPLACHLIQHPITI